MIDTEQAQKIGVAIDALQANPQIKPIIAEVWGDDCYRLNVPGTLDGGLFVDVGANVGVTTLTALAVGAERVIAVEPDAINLDLLRKHLHATGTADRVEVLHAAVGRPMTGVQVHRSSDHPDGCYGSSWTSPPEPDASTVPQVTLDELIPPGDAVLKLDIEGGEYEALGALGVEALAARVERLVMEWHHFPARGIDAFTLLPELVGRLLTRFDVEIVGPPHLGGLLFAQRR